VPGTREIVAHPNYIVVYQARSTRLLSCRSSTPANSTRRSNRSKQTHPAESPPLADGFCVFRRPISAATSDLRPCATCVKRLLCKPGPARVGHDLHYRLPTGPRFRSAPAQRPTPRGRTERVSNQVSLIEGVKAPTFAPFVSIRQCCPEMKG
jgi:hypothetical protein